VTSRAHSLRGKLSSAGKPNCNRRGADAGATGSGSTGNDLIERCGNASATTVPAWPRARKNPSLTSNW